MQNQKMDVALNNLLSRQDYLVTQANDLARSFGNLTSFEHKVLDYCFSFVKKDDVSDKMYHLKSLDILHHLGLNSSGKNYQRVVKAFKALNEGTAIYMAIKRPDGDKGILMTSLFDHIAAFENGGIEFRFSRDISPYVFQLKEHFYSFKLSELSRVRSKYTLTLMKLWNANAMGKLTNTTIKGSLSEWEAWFLGSDKEGKQRIMPAGVFKRDVLKRAEQELQSLYPDVQLFLTTKKQGVKVVGYELDIVRLKTHLKL